MSGDPTTSFPQDAQSFVGTDTSTGSHSQKSRASAIHLLRQKILTSATHDSPTRDPPPRCHADTREFALETILAFVDDPEPDEAVMWMNAPPGHGKSAVMQTAIEHLLASFGSPHHFAGSFSFGRDKEGRDEVQYLLPTLLYQIAYNVPETYEHIGNAILSDPTLLSKPIESQLVPLLVAPFQHCTLESTHTPTIFIDGLDQCHSIAAQLSVLKMIADVITVHRVPLRFVIASRLDAHLNKSFNSEPFRSITRSFTLDDDFIGRLDYLQEGFDRIRESRMDVMSGVPIPWPPNEIMSYIIRETSGQYLIASAILCFVGDEHKHPAEQLMNLFTPNPRFSDMDSLYTHILSVSTILPNRDLINVLGLIVSCKSDVTMASVSDVLDLPLSSVLTAIRNLQSIIKIEEVPTFPSHDTDFSLSSWLSPIISIRHISLKEFLVDKARAGDFWIDLDNITTMLRRRSEVLVASSISESASSVTVHPTTWQCLICPWVSEEVGESDKSPWPLFTREFSYYRDANPLQRQAAGRKPQSLRAFCFVLGQWNDPRYAAHDFVTKKDFEVVESVVAAFLREQFKAPSQESRDLFGLFTYLDNDDGEKLGTTLGAIKNQPDVSFNSALRAIQSSASVFLTLEPGIETFEQDYSRIRVCVDRSIMDILVNPDLIEESQKYVNQCFKILPLSSGRRSFKTNDDLQSMEGYSTSGNSNVLDSEEQGSPPSPLQLSIHLYSLFELDHLSSHPKSPDGTRETSPSPPQFCINLFSLPNVENIL